MLRNVDRHAPQAERRLKVGDRVRLPLDDLLRPRLPLYKHTFEVVSFAFATTMWCGPGPGHPDYGYRPQHLERSDMSHIVHLRRLADGWTCAISASYVTHFRDQLGEWWLDESTGHKNINRLAVMRGDFNQVVWSMGLELRHFQEARWNREQRLLDIRWGVRKSA